MKLTDLIKFIRHNFNSSKGKLNQLKLFIFDYKSSS